MGFFFPHKIFNYLKLEEDHYRREMMYSFGLWWSNYQSLSSESVDKIGILSLSIVKNMYFF